MNEQTTFELRTDLSNLPQTIDFNFEEMKAYLTENLEKYKTLVVTEDAIGAAKVDRAKLRKLADAINQHKITIKRDYMSAYTDFEVKVKELISLIDSATDNIDRQVKSFETLAKEEKRAALEKFFAENAEEATEVLTFEKIFNPKWLNATYSVDAAHADILLAIKKVKADTEAIRSMGSPYTAMLIETYSRTLDMRDVVQCKITLELREKAEEERRAKAEEEKREAEGRERARLETEQKKDEIRSKAQAAEKILFHREATNEEYYDEPTMEQIDFRVWVTPEQKIKLRNFIIENKIKYGRVPT